MSTNAALDAAATAIANPTRRQLIEHLATGPTSVSTLAELLEVTLPAVLKQLGILERAGIVARHKTGRVVTVALVPGSLAPLQEWALRSHLFWTGHLDRFAAHVSPTRPGTGPT